MSALSSDLARLHEYIGVRVKKHFRGYGDFEGYVSKVDKKAKDGMTIHIEYDDDDRGWLDFKEFSKVALRDADGNLIFHEVKRKTPASTSAGPASKRSKRGHQSTEANAEPIEDAEAAGPSSAKAVANGKGKASAKKEAKSSKKEAKKDQAKKDDIQKADAKKQDDKTDDVEKQDDKQEADKQEDDQLELPSKPGLATLLADIKKTAKPPEAKPEEVKAPVPDKVEPPTPQSEGTANKNRPKYKYSQVVTHGGVVYISGQTARDTESEEGRTYQGQTEQVLEQLDEMLASVGINKQRLLQVRVYLRDMQEGRDIFNRCWLDWVEQDALPARTVVEAKLVRENLLVEVEAVAALHQT